VTTLDAYKFSTVYASAIRLLKDLCAIPNRFQLELEKKQL
jgi:hypothetical protein